MNLKEAMRERHSVRVYSGKQVEAEKINALNQAADACNRESGLHIQLVADEPKAFDGMMAHFGKFTGVKNYFALVGKRDGDLQEKCGYYGERLVLIAQSIGLNSCWAGLTYKKIPSAFEVGRGEKLCAVIAFGYGASQGAQHKSKLPEQVSKGYGTAPEWFQRGIDAALLAPTAMNQQKFLISFNEGKVTAKALSGVYSRVDLGIVKLHFELGAGVKIEWE